MSVHFICGKPGAGKSLYAVRWVLRELRQSKRSIVTNLPLDVPRICEYLHDEYGESFNASQRIQILDMAETGSFYRHRNLGYRIEERERVEFENRHLDVLKMPMSEGVLYALDEVDIYFSARGYASNSGDLFWYFKQHRKLGDDCLLIVQHEGNVDKQLRTLAQDYTYCRNRGKAKMPGFFGLVRQISGFTAQQYQEPYRAGAVQTDLTYFTLDEKGVASCYRTQQGVGLRGGAADMGRKEVKGVSPVVLVVGIVAALVLIAWLPGKLFRMYQAKNNPQISSGVAKSQVAAPVPALRPNAGNAIFLGNNDTVANDHGRKNTNDVVLTGVARLPGGERWIFLSDGRRFSSLDSIVRYIGRDRVVIGQQTFSFQ